MTTLGVRFGVVAGLLALAFPAIALSAPVLDIEISEVTPGLHRTAPPHSRRLPRNKALYHRRNAVPVKPKAAIQSTVAPNRPSSPAPALQRPPSGNNGTADLPAATPQPTPPADSSAPAPAGTHEAGPPE